MADNLGIDIIYYEDGNSAPCEFKSKFQVFGKPLVLQNMPNGVMLLYTQSQASCLAVNDIDKVVFSKERILESIKEKARDEERKLLRIKRKQTNTEAKTYESTVQQLLVLLEDLADRICNYLDSIRYYVKKKELLNDVLAKLLNPELLHTELRSNRMVMKLRAGFAKKLQRWENCFKQKSSLFDLFDAFAKKNQDPKQCDVCETPCKPYECYRVSCGHVLDKQCFER